MSKLKTCKTCSKEVAKSAKSCPHCGARLKMGFFKKVGIGFGCFIGLMILIIAANGDDLEKKGQEAVAERNQASTTTEKKDSTVATTTTTEKKDTQTPAKTEEPKKEPAKVTWNTKELDATKNGNIQIAVKQLQSAGDITQNAVADEPALVNKAPWNYYGKIVKMTGTVEVVQDYPPASDISKMLGGKESAEIVLVTADDTIVDMFASVSTGNLKVGDTVTVYGYPVGQAEVANKVGGKFTHLIIVGNKFQK